MLSAECTSSSVAVGISPASAVMEALHCSPLCPAAAVVRAPPPVLLYSNHAADRATHVYSNQTYLWHCQKRLPHYNNQMGNII